MFKDVKAAVQ